MLRLNCALVAYPAFGYAPSISSFVTRIAPSALLGLHLARGYRYVVPYPLRGVPAATVRLACASIASSLSMRATCASAAALQFAQYHPPFTAAALRHLLHMPCSLL